MTARWTWIGAAAVSALLSLAPTVAISAVTVTRDDGDRIAAVAIDRGSRGPFEYEVEAEPGADVRVAPARLVQKLHMGSVVVRFTGFPIEIARPLQRDPVTRVPVASAEGPSERVFDDLAHLSEADVRFRLICASSIGFDPNDDPCAQLEWIRFVYGGAVPIDWSESPAFRALPRAETELEAALLGCGAPYETDCEHDGMNLRFADPNVLFQEFPVFAPVVPAGGDSDLLRIAAWNWFARHALAADVEPGTGIASSCTFETPEPCADLGVRPERFTARRVLEDEPIPGPALRWDWEMGTTFALDTLEIEGSVSPEAEAYYRSVLPSFIHFVGPFSGADGEPDAVALRLLPEPAGAGAAGATLLGLVRLQRARRPSR